MTSMKSQEQAKRLERQGRLVCTLALGLALLGMTSAASAEETVGTFTLDGLSYVAFGDDEVFGLPAGSTLRFHFGTAGNGRHPGNGRDH